MAKTANVPTVRIPALRLEESVYDTYAERATKRGRTVEDEIAKHLTSTANYNATTPIYLSDDDRNALTQLAGVMIQTPADLFAWAKRLAALKIGEVQIELSERLATRLDTRKFGADWTGYLTRTVTECLEEKVGMR